MNRFVNKIKLNRVLGLFAFMLSACAADDSGTFLYSNSLAPDQVVIMTSLNGNNRGIHMYDLEGNFIKMIAHYRDTVEIGLPRQIAMFDSASFLVALDANDRVEKLDFAGNKATFHGSNQLNGAIYGAARVDNGYVYVIESNRIEAFDSTGARDASRYITTTVGGCTLSSPRFIISNGNQLIVTDYNAHRIHTYDVSAGTPTCLSSVASAANNPYAITMNSSGGVYYTTWSNDQVYSANLDGSSPTVVWSTDLTRLNNPAGLGEMPDGTLIVSSYSGTPAIVRIDTSGNDLGDFIRDPLIVTINDLKIINREGN